MTPIRCRLGFHDWRFVRYLHSHLRDGEKRDERGRLILWDKELACQRCHLHSARMTVSTRRDYRPPDRPGVPLDGKDWDVACYTIVPDRHGEGMDDYCTHPRHSHLVFGEPVTRTDDEDFWTWYEGPCQHCHCDGFTPA